MIPTTTYENVLSSGNTEVKSAQIAMTPEMFELLSAGIYEDRPLAVIREILCNGRDGQKEAGNLSQAMILQLPNTFEPFLSFRDFGTGLTHDQVFEIYLTYGASTKRGSNDYVGMFGIGSKSPLSYTDSFIVISYINGIEYQYNIYKDNGIPKIAKLFERSTTEQNGFKVSVAIKQKDFMTFRGRTETFLKLFDFPVKVIGQENLNTEAKIFEKNDKYWIVDNYREGCFAIMGGVTYKLSQEIYTSLRETISAQTIILPFGLGDLNVASSRENLSYVDGDETDSALKARVSEIKSIYFSNLNKDIANCIYINDAVDKLVDTYRMPTQWGGRIKNDNRFEYRGLPLSEWHKHLDEDIEYRCFIQQNSYRTGNKTAKEVNYKSSLSLGVGKTKSYRINMDKLFFFDGDRGNGNIKAVRAYVRENGGIAIYDSTEDEKKWLQGLIGSLKTVKCTDVYEGLFPKKDKSERTTIRKVSGVFKYENGMYTEVKELPEDVTGHYVDMVRDSVEIDGKSFPRNKLNILVDSGKFDKIYFIRKTAAKYNRPETLTKINELVEILNSLTNKKMRKIYHRSCVLDSISQMIIPSEFKDLWNEIKHRYPTVFWYSQCRYKEKSYRIVEGVYDLLIELGISNNSSKKIDKNRSRIQKKFAKESEKLTEDYPLMGLYNTRSHWMTNTQKTALIRAVEWEISGSKEV